MLDNTLPKDYLKKKETEALMQAVFASFGYSETGIRTEKMSLAKELAACCKKTDTRRMCCSTLGSENSARYGIVLADAETPAAVTEPIAASLEALLAVGIEDFYVRIGSDAFVKALCENADKKNAAALFSAVTAGNRQELETLLADSGSEFKDIIINLSDAIGDESLSERLGKLPKKAGAAFDGLSEVFKILILYGFEKFPVIDLGMVSGGEYDDVYFKIFISNTDKPVCTGGTVDGCAAAEFDLDMLAEFYDMHEEKVSKTLIYPEKNASGIAYDIAFNLRINGCMTEGYVENGSFKDAEKYAKKTNADCMIRVFSDGKIMIKDFKDGSITETTAEDFLGYYEEDDGGCGCGHEHGECDCGHHHHH